MLFGCLDVPSLKDIVVVPQSGGKYLCRLGIVLLHLLLCQKCGVQQVWLIHPSCLIRYCQSFLQCSWSSRILCYHTISNQWLYRVIYLLCPAWWSFFFIFPYYASMSARTLGTKAGLTCDFSRSYTYQSILHCLLSMILFMTHQSYSFLWYPISYKLFEMFAQKSSDASSVPYIDLLASLYIHFLPRLSV